MINKELKTIDTILFDLDGTLINTIELIVASFLHTMEHYYPGKYTREDVITFIGPPLSETFTNLDPSKVEEMTKTYRTYNHAKHDELVKEYEGVYETLEKLEEKGYKMAIVTTKSRGTAVRGLELMKLDKFFDVVVSLDEVENYKPHPEPLEKAMAALQADRSKTLMVGDSKHDILGGKNAGTKTAGVAWSIQGKESLQTYEPDIMLDTMPELLHYLGVE
ncbi:pyrophosphatase PpaX [Evansella cellulosilytica]|uniref:Pyrophosphatase PpaX n=1 Tax=Evansella cellulosilytica (strain ATCC 21833 / DSM 2522 / FERM P-1141 / JCM 9156 / N-4) TaxID=649639 RepID=E6TRI2_EVAC2|nr:pyrophosphatase PpaX [Evansella cellulosilytica]ADU31812.1 HAD-superfamily hydrolase, subfamily IA, variant 1 [Evansella cellulosilytica DSM 2522]